MISGSLGSFVMTAPKTNQLGSLIISGGPHLKVKDMRIFHSFIHSFIDPSNIYWRSALKHLCLGSGDTRYNPLPYGVYIPGRGDRQDTNQVKVQQTRQQRGPSREMAASGSGVQNTHEGAVWSWMIRLRWGGAGGRMAQSYPPGP